MTLQLDTMIPSDDSQLKDNSNYDQWYENLHMALLRLQHTSFHLPDEEQLCNRFMEGLQWEMVHADCF